MEVVFAHVMPGNAFCVSINDLEVYGGRVCSHIAQEHLLESFFLIHGCFLLIHSVLAT